MNQTLDSSRRSAVNRALLLCALSLGLSLALAAPVAHAAKPRASTPALAGVVNVNTATPDQLELLPGVGTARARAIVAHRKQQGGFRKVGDLLDVKGIGESMLQRMRPFVTVSGKTTARNL